MPDEPQVTPESGRGRLRTLPAQVDLPALEREVLARWRQGKVFQRSLEQTETGPQWVFYEGPPTANGMPGVHHVEARVFKDLFPRFKTMKGYSVRRKAGWDCHGLPVEVAVEKELGISGKRDIESYGVAEFNARCRESVLRHVDAFEAMTERMGYWVDLAQAYRTMDPEYVEAVWWSLKTVFDKGLLVRDHRISPYCPRCGTPLSDHELGQPGGYETVTDPSVTVRFPITEGPLEGADLLIWTTTPWTLVSNTAVAVHPDVTYVVAARSGEPGRVVVAEPLFARVLGEGWHILSRLQGSELVGTPYRRPFDLVEIPNAHRVLGAEFVTTEDGTGLVHMAPAFGADDFATCRAAGMPIVNPVNPDGRFDLPVPLVGGTFFKDADARLVEDLRERGLLFRVERYEHSYPHCWRCHTPLLYYALPAWYIKTTAIKDRLLAENERTNWFPATIKEGRYGEWLRNNVDWSLSRSRYWGTPLPIWLCEDDHAACVGSLKELGELAGQDLSALDPHRPYVDDVTFACPECGKEARRVPDVIDAWYDSGSMPFAQWGAPHRRKEIFEASYPAQYICEAIDQTRGWFYSLMAVGALVFDRSSYENVVCLGHILAEDGRKMSKHLGNVLEPIPLMDKHGADALRWYMAAAGQPWAARRVGDAALEEIVRKILLTYWNTASFFALYANAAGWTPDTPAPAYADRPLLDRWVLAELHRTVREVDTALEGFDTAAAGRRLAEFIDDLSNWYVRRSRRRFWEGPEQDGTGENAAAFATLYECLETLTRLMAPIAPFVTDYVWDVLRRDGDADSVHLASWPEVDETLLDPELSARMALVRRLVELGRSARAASGVRTRQPLGRALVGAAGWASLPDELRAQIADELNVQGFDTLASIGGELVEYQVKPNFRELGKRFAKQTPKVAAAVTSADPAGLVHALRDSGTATVDAAEVGKVDLTPDDVIVTERPRSGWAVESAAGETVALDLTVTPELRRAGLAREVIRLVQDARKNSGLDISDRIDLWWRTSDAELADALRGHGDEVAGEVLADTWQDGEPDADLPAFRDEELRLTFWLRRSA
ncbi:isoleucine--tRNA ligase [Actinoallomurus spadix]|uniref:Isoleucine--tRNA ligase n=1 Tax=Actinoallomurus spadix TaxID=79912 RepID=A0ABN0W331_9ACTN|nr:isoleucine--tRNA ligase [Actinoallomurus spadix]MCO5985520.1 isoleucine--tRNA ligase [Actinoallomurus spadix]